MYCRAGANSPKALLIASHEEERVAWQDTSIAIAAACSFSSSSDVGDGVAHEYERLLSKSLGYGGTATISSRQFTNYGSAPAGPAPTKYWIPSPWISSSHCRDMLLSASTSGCSSAEMPSSNSSQDSSSRDLCIVSIHIGTAAVNSKSSVRLQRGHDALVASGAALMSPAREGNDGCWSSRSP